MHWQWVLATAIVGVSGCGDATEIVAGDDNTDSSDSAEEESTGTILGSSGGSSGVTPKTGSSGAVDGTASSSSETGGISGGVFANGTFEIPSNATVEEFSFTANAAFSPGILDGREIVVAVVDISHPKRDQLEICPGSHPLDGCATVDYGAFGMTHDNRISFEGADGPITIHLFKDRTLQPDPESLPASE